MLVQWGWHSKNWQKLHWFIVFHISIWGLGVLFVGSKPTKSSSWRQDVTRRIFWGFEQLSCSIAWQGVVLLSDARNMDFREIYQLPKVEVLRLPPSLEKDWRLIFVGDVTTIWLCPANQFAGATETHRGAHVALGQNVWPHWLVSHVLWKKCCTITQHV